MEQLRQGEGVTRPIGATAPTERADGTALAPGEISHYLWTLQLQGGVKAEPIAVDLVDGKFSEEFDPDQGVPGVYDLSYQTVDTGSRVSVPSSTLTIEVLAPLAAPNPPVIG